MAIVDLQPKQGNVDVVVDVVEKEDPRSFSKFGKEGRVCNAVVKDETGTIKLTLWNDDVDKINVGDKVHITNGYVNEWQGEKQLTTGKFGKMEVVGQGTQNPDSKSKNNNNMQDDAEEKNVYIEEENLEEF